MQTPAVYQQRAAKTEATIAARSLEVFQSHRSWRFAHRKRDNHPFFIIDGSPVRQKDGTVHIPSYYTDLRECTCPSHVGGRVACKHMRGVRLWFEAVKRGEIVIPRRMTAGDHAVMEGDRADAAARDVAESADALLDAYSHQQAARREAQWAEPEQDWWTTQDGGIVWLQEGDWVGPDTEARSTSESLGVPTTVRKAGLDALWPSCRAAGCSDDPEPHEHYCARHVLCDAF